MNGKDLFRGLSYINKKFIDEAEYETIRSPEAKHGKRLLHKSLLIAAVVATMMLLMGAAVYTHWSGSMQRYYQPTEKAKQQAEKTGLSVMYEEQAQEEEPGLSVTDQGITVTVVQTIADQSEAKVILRVEGFTPPEDILLEPFAFFTTTLDGEEQFWGSYQSRFDPGITKNEKGEEVYTDGTPVKTQRIYFARGDNSGQEGPYTSKYDKTIQEGEDGKCYYPDGTQVDAGWELFTEGHYIQQDGSMELIITHPFPSASEENLGKELGLHFTGFGVLESKGRADMEEKKLVEGHWDLTLTLTGSSETVKVTPNARLTDNVTLTEAEIGEISMKMWYKTDTYWDGWEQLGELEPRVAGVKLKNGTFVSFWCCMEGYVDEENLIYYREARAEDGVVELDQIESLVFIERWEDSGNGNYTPVYQYVSIG